MNAQQVRVLLASHPHEVNKVAKSLKLTPTVAVNIRERWFCQLGGRFDRDQTLSVLQELQPTDVLLRRECSQCKKTINFKVEHILKCFLKKGGFYPSKLCWTCKKKKQISSQSKAPPKAPASKKKPPKKKPMKKKQAKKLAPPVGDSNSHLTWVDKKSNEVKNKPFANLALQNPKNC